ncbi:DUF4344 domain-containing metallopeptidase [Streptomyces sp. NPDC060334]|uniref:DUF4344 domain-containing metallopeptidase n=1 Tax=Streptomyces sp. NPDC060334 TaxID=3347099 RepID=UPI003652BBE5
MTGTPTRAAESRRAERHRPESQRAESRRAERHRVLPAALTASLCAALATALLSGGCAPAPRGFAVRYEAPAAGDEREAAFLRDGKHADRAVTRLNAYLDLPDRVTVVARSCAGEGTAYDPAAHRIDLCYDDMAEDRELLTTDEKVGAIVAESVYHEAGHALVEALELPVGPDPDEENTADRFAALMLLREGPDGERALRTAAEEYELLAAREPDTAPDEDEHAPPADRAAAYLCLLHGAAPDRHPDLATRTRDCAPTWPTTRATWEHALAPLLR